MRLEGACVTSARPHDARELREAIIPFTAFAPRPPDGGTSQGCRHASAADETRKQRMRLTKSRACCWTAVANSKQRRRRQG
eukprot:352779-Alexandrium_andersonii.AAC.1